MAGNSEVSVRPTTLESAAEAIILAGTHRWTGSPFEELRPRPLLPVAQTPIIDYVLRWLKANGVQQATICANGSTIPLREHVQDGRRFGVTVRYHEDPTPRGAAGCVKDASAASQARLLIVADGTAVPVVDLRAVLAYHRDTGAVLTIVAHDRAAASAGFPLLQTAGIYVFNRDVLDRVPATSFQDIKETLIPKLYRDGHRIEVFLVPKTSPHVMSAESYLAANYWAVEHQTASAAAGSRGLNAPLAGIASDARVIGPVTLGAGVRVMAGATIVGPASIGDGTVIGPGAVVARSVVWNNCTIGEGALVDGSILADDVVIPAGSTVTNALRLAAPDPRTGRRLAAGSRSDVRRSAAPAWS
jgi:NDP-sugar pyrophosphorylase family protein